MHRTTLVSSARRIVLAAALVCSAVSPGAAQESVAADSATIQDAASRGPALGLVLEMGVEYGGDPVATVTYEDGSYQEITGGEGLAFGIGGEVRPSEGSPFALRATVGYKYNPSNATNASIALSRVPVRVIASYDLTPAISLGGGVVHHSAVRFDGDGLGPDLEFENANGAVVELVWNGIGLSYTSMRYVDEQGADYNASNIGFIFTYTLGRRTK
jgi:hypothetical protein